MKSRRETAMEENFKVLYGREQVPRGTNEGEKMATEFERWIQRMNEAQRSLRLKDDSLHDSLPEGFRASLNLQQVPTASGLQFVWTASIGPVIHEEADTAQRAMANATKRFIGQLEQEVEQAKRTEARLLQVIQGLRI